MNLNARLGKLEQRAGLTGPPGHVCITAVERVIVSPESDVEVDVIRRELAGPCHVCGKERRRGHQS